MPLRAAVTLTILMIQKESKERAPFDVRYDLEYEDTALLSGGKVKPKREFEVPPST